jgi:hypothetical protein
MFVGAYWSRRAETRRQAARRIAAFLENIRGLHDELASWFLQVETDEEARDKLGTTAGDISRRLRVNRTDFGKRPIKDLGFSLGAWNGRNASVSFHVGSYATSVGNSAVLDVDMTDSNMTAEGLWRTLLEGAVRAFEPAYAVVVSEQALRRSETAQLIEIGWLTYRPSTGISVHPGRR